MYLFFPFVRKLPFWEVNAKSQQKSQDCAHFAQKTCARKANPSADGPNSTLRPSNRSIFAPLAYADRWFSLVFGSLDEVGRLRDFEDDHKTKQCII